MGVQAFFLGSSVTYGWASGGVSFVEMCAEALGWSVVKEAVSGTTMADLDGESYIARLRRTPETVRAGVFVCQLSTNDAARGVPLGALGQSPRDERTVAGAIEAIVAEARRRWRAPIAFYTSPRFDSPRYGEMVALLSSAAERLGFSVIDLWNDAAFNDLSGEQRAAYMADAVHPTREGYRAWWTPRFAQALARLAPQ